MPSDRRPKVASSRPRPPTSYSCTLALRQKTVPELRSLAHRRRLIGYSRLRKAELIRLLTRKARSAPATTRQRSVVYASNGELQTKAYRIALWRALQNGVFALKACKVNKLFASGTGRTLTDAQKASASSSIIMMGTLPVQVPGNRDVVVKLAFQPLTAKDNSLEVERQVYEKVTTPLLMNDNTPHTIHHVASARCDAFDKTLVKLEKKRDKQPAYIQTLLSAIVALGGGRRGTIFGTQSDVGGRGRTKMSGRTRYDRNIMYLLILERGRGGTFGKWYRQKQTWEEWQHVLFQIVYTLACFNEVGLMHNDLHSDNIWIDTIKPQRFAYEVTPTTKFEFATKNFCKLYDFDLSSKRETTYNSARIYNTLLETDVDFCKRTGRCNRKNPKGDLFKLLWYVYHSGMRAQAPNVAAKLKTWILGVVDQSLIERDLAWQGSLCLPREPGKDACKPIDPTNMMTPHEVLTTKFHTLHTKRFQQDQRQYQLPSVTRQRQRRVGFYLEPKVVN